MTLLICMSRTSQSPDHPKRKQVHVVEQTQLETVTRSSGRGVKSCSWWERKTKASSCEWTTQSETTTSEEAERWMPSPFGKSWSQRIFAP